LGVNGLRRLPLIATEVLFVLASASALAQDQGLPKTISGRWNVYGGSASQVFSLEEISQGQDKTFTAKLTWWTVNSACVVRAESISGRVTASGLAFDAKTKCDVSFSVELNRAEGSWVGKGATTSGPQVQLDLKAN
jgi:hypothetical protein